MTLGTSQHRDVVACPWRMDGRRLRGGLYEDGAYLPAAELRRLNRPGFCRPLADPPRDAPLLDAPHVIWAGPHLGGFGHFLLESLARLWFAPRRPHVPVLWSGARGHAAWQRDALALVGVGNPSLFLHAPARLPRVTIPDPGYVIPAVFRPRHDAFLSVVPPSPVVPGRRAWLSRSRLPPENGHVEGEAALEGALADRGWTVFHPQEHALRDQLAFLSSCELVAGWEGSAFHGLILMAGLRTRLLIVARSPDLNPNYLTIAERKGFDQTVLRPALALVGGEGHRKVWRLRDGTAPLLAQLLDA